MLAYSLRIATRKAARAVTSTSGALHAIFYFLIKHHGKLVKLTREFEDAFEDGTLTSSVQYSQATKLSYLMVVVQESLRLSPPFGVVMPRYVSGGSMHFFSHHIHGGSKVGECDGHTIRRHSVWCRYQNLHWKACEWYRMVLEAAAHSLMAL
jgi:cytochrome P450